MRVVGGSLRGRVYALGGFKGRPTMDRAREGLLNLVAHRRALDESDVLDLYSGSGAVGIEFASWGARSVVCVERYAPHAELIRQHVARFSLDTVRVIRMDAIDYLHRANARYDIIFADPPYDAPQLPILLSRLLKSGLVSPGTLVIVEHPRGLSLEAPQWAERREYGQSAFTICEAHAPSPRLTLIEKGTISP